MCVLLWESSMKILSHVHLKKLELCQEDNSVVIVCEHFFSASFSKNPWIIHALFHNNLSEKFLYHKMLHEHWSLLATILDLVHWPNLAYKLHYCVVPYVYFVFKQNLFCKRLIMLKGCTKLLEMTILWRMNFALQMLHLLEKSCDHMMM
jgi:hypothetical protein